MQKMTVIILVYLTTNVLGKPQSAETPLNVVSPVPTEIVVP